MIQGKIEWSDYPFIRLRCTEFTSSEEGDVGRLPLLSTIRFEFGFVKGERYEDWEDEGERMMVVCSFP